MFCVQKDLIKNRAIEVSARLKKLYPKEASELCELKFANAFQLLVATILSAQCTDERVNQVMPAVIKKFPTPQKMAAAELSDIAKVIKPTGFFNSKAKSLKEMSLGLKQFGWKVPDEMEDLVKLKGVGRKTANVILSVGFNKPGLPVDTHVIRLSNRLGLVNSRDAKKIEEELCKMLNPKDWGAFSLRLILHGRRVCTARSPKCTDCILADICPSAQL
jgi:endonuclease-3